MSGDSVDDTPFDSSIDASWLGVPPSDVGAAEGSSGVEEANPGPAALG
jgi:hypothetical protein